MGTPINATLVKNLGKILTANNGEMIVFELRLADANSDQYTDEDFVIQYDALQLLVAGLVDGINMADELREKNPMHKGGVQGGFAFRLKTTSIGPSSKRRGEHIVEFGVEGAQGGKLKYRVLCGRTELENLCDLLAQYLDSPEGHGQAQPSGH